MKIMLYLRKMFIYHPDENHHDQSSCCRGISGTQMKTITINLPAAEEFQPPKTIASVAQEIGVSRVTLYGYLEALGYSGGYGGWKVEFVPLLIEELLVLKKWCAYGASSSSTFYSKSNYSALRSQGKLEGHLNRIDIQVSPRLSTFLRKAST